MIAAWVSLCIHHACLRDEIRDLRKCVPESELKRITRQTKSLWRPTRRKSSAEWTEFSTITPTFTNIPYTPVFFRFTQSTAREHKQYDD
jgi:hypothetical protein